MRVLFAHKANTGVGLYRQWIPAKYLAREAGWETRTYPRWAPWDRVLAGHGKVFDIGADLNWADLFVCGWFASPAEQQALVQWRQATGIPCVMDLDDEVRNLPEGHMARDAFRERTPEECFERIPCTPEAIRVLSMRGWQCQRDAEGALWAVRQRAENFPARFQETLGHLNGLFVSTPYLAQEYRAVLPAKWPVSVLPNCYDPEEWAPVAPAPPRPNPTILWAGSIAHGGNVKVAFQGLKRVFKAMPDAKLVVMGARLKEFEELGDRVEWAGWTSLEAYPVRLAAQGAWVAIAPATDHPFNKAKSHIRWMEYTLAGIPTVASPIPEYLTWADDGAWFANSDEEWAGRLLELLGDATLRTRLLDAALERVKLCDIRQQLDKWVHHCTEAVQAGVTQMYTPPTVPEGA